MPDTAPIQAGIIRAKAIPKPPAPCAPSRHGAEFCVVAIGASAGGLEACTKLLDALPTPTGMAFILVQHLAPNQNSMLVDLLAEHTALAVVQAADGMPVEAEHLYVIPPGSYLSVGAGAIRLSAPETRDGAPHGARLPFDVLLHSMAREYGPRAACVVLSGTGGDGSAGLRAVKAAGGLVIVQDPAEAGYDGMPRSAMATGLVDAVVPAAGIPAALASHAQASHAQAGGGHADSPPSNAALPLAETSGAAQPDPVTGIIELLRERTKHDFAPYKRGTLERRIERRMGLALSGQADAARYLDLLRGDAAELDLLAKDLLIHVTSFFRDPPAFKRPGKAGHPRPAGGSRAQRAGARLDPRVQHGRGGLLPRDPVPRGDGGGPERQGRAGRQAAGRQAGGRQTAGVRLRHRRGCRGDGAGGPVSHGDHVRRVGRTPGPVLHQGGRARLPRASGYAGRRWCSRCRTCWPTRPSPAWTSCPAAT